MIRINQLKLNIKHSEADLKEKILKVLRISEDSLLSYEIKKQSLDARRKPELFYVYAVDVKVKNVSSVKKRVRNQNVQFKDKPLSYQIQADGTEVLNHRPVVIGTGPAGLFCGYQLAVLGYRPILLERGACVEERMQAVERFWATGELDQNCNVQFGEGGAGTFSDGKLNTLVHDSNGRSQKVLELFVEYGAPKEILYQHKPHIGTDVLSRVVKNIREAILSYGGEVRFLTQVTDILSEPAGKGRRLTALQVYDHAAGKEDTIKTDIAVLAIGHSARDTFSMLLKNEIPMEAKSFAVGVRMEHPQAMIDEFQYGMKNDGTLPPASYKLTENLACGRGVYTFCMCPGGYVVNASSEPGRLAVNGMSYHDRAGENANSAIIVTVTPEDFCGMETGAGTDRGCEAPGDAMAGIRFQRRLEETAFCLGKGNIPIQLYGDFKEGRVSEGFGGVNPAFRGGYAFANLRELFPEPLSRAFMEGMEGFGTMIRGFDRPDAILAGIESRTSSPVRIPRDQGMESPVKGIFPCGEGAGYAGGITSAAMDGIKTAEEIIRRYSPLRPSRTVAKT